MKSYYLILLILVLMVGCFDQEYKKPMKYFKNGIEYSCTGSFINGELTRVICFNNTRDTILKEFYAKGEFRDSSVSFFSSGMIKETGRYADKFKSGIWKSYFENGELQSFQYYNPDLDSFNLFYEKVYNINGALKLMMLPLEYRTSSMDGKYKIGETYELYIDLKYSEYDSVKSLLIIDPNPMSKIKIDTILCNGRAGYIQFTPQKVGKHRISGTYFELNGNDPTPDENKVAEKPFRFDYEAIRQGEVTRFQDLQKEMKAW